jgi:hypothetical protein
VSLEEVQSWWCTYDAYMFYPVPSSVVGQCRLHPLQTATGTPSLLVSFVCGVDWGPPASGYNAVHGFGLEEEPTEPSDGPIGCGELVRRGCLFAWNFTMTKSTVFAGGEGKD